MGTANLTSEADGDKIRRERERADLTINGLAEALRVEEGITRHPDTLRNIELGRQPGMELFNAIARVLHRRTEVERSALLTTPKAAS